MTVLPAPPKVELEIVGDRSLEREGFLALKRYELVTRRDDEVSSPFRYDVVERRALDAAVMAAHYLGPNGKPYVYLRSAVRPPVALRPIDPRCPGVLWELPAGLVEPGEAAHVAAARELEEELGFAKEPEAMVALGPWCFPAPGFVAELHWFFHVRVDPAARVEPAGDGSPLEEGARIVSMALDDALAACQTGEIRDAKTELALRRLLEVLG